jgi:3-oxoacyl-[acyl-carrier-protein] synthase II
VPRAVITGIGLVGPTGLGKDRFWQALLTRESAIGRLSRFDSSGYSCQVAGEVRDRGYEQLIEPRKLRSTTLVTQFALAAAEYALRDARLPREFYYAEERGIVVGTALGGWRDGEQQYGILLARGARRVNPFIANGAASHTPGVELAATLGAQGPQVTFASGCPSSLQAISNAAALIRAGEARVCLAGGFEAPLSPLVFAGLTRTQELSTANDDPQRASRPFDRDHGGMILSEGSCLLVVENEVDAVRRGAPIYATVLGGGLSCDAQGVFGTDGSGEVAARALRQAVVKSHIDPSEIDYVCSHANSLPVFDRKDAIVLRRAFGERAGCLPVGSIKGVTGHPFGASGAFQTAAACMALHEQMLPPNTNLEHADTECTLNLLGCEPLASEVRHALVTSYGYGGVNAYLVLGRP